MSDALFWQETRQFLQEFKRNPFPHLEHFSDMIDEFHSFFHSSEDDKSSVKYKRKECSNDNGKSYQDDVQNKLSIHDVLN